MNRKFLSILGIFLLISTYFIGFPSNASAPVFSIKPVWFNGNGSLMPVPGMYNVPLTLYVKNLGPTLYNVTIGVNLTFPFSMGYLIKNNSYLKYNSFINIPEFPQNENISLFFLINISQSAKDGIYIENLYVNGTYSPNYPRINLTQQFYLPLEGYINLIPVAMYPETFNGYIIPDSNPYPIDLILENDGNQPVINLTLTLIPSYPLYGKSVYEKISAIPAFGYVKIQFLSDIYYDIKNGTYPEKIIYSYYNVKSYFIANLTISGSYSFSSNAYFGIPNNPINPAPGQKNVPFTINLINTGTMVGYSLNISIYPVYPLIGNIQNFSINVIYPGQEIPLTIIVSVENNIKPEIYSLPISITMKNISININAKYIYDGYYSLKPLFSNLFTNNSIIPGPGMNNVPINFVLSNIGDVPIDNVTFYYTPTYPFLGKAQKLEIPIIIPYQPIRLTFFVNISRNATSGYYQQFINYSYMGMNGILNYTVLIPGYNKLVLSTYFFSPIYIYQNETYNILHAIIINEGNSPAFNVTIYSTSSLEILNGGLNLTIMPGMVVNYTVIFNSPDEPGIYPIFIHINKEIYEINVTVYERPSINVIYNIPNVSPGQNKAQITFVIENNGPGTIYMANIHLILPNIMSLHVSSSNPLGALFLNNITIFNIQPGETFKIPYLIDVEDNANPGKYDGQLLLIVYKNNTMKPIIYSFTFNMIVSTPFFSANGNNATLTLSNLTIIILVIIIVALIGILIKQRKR
ncbi:MAG: hypothetical protein ACP5IB_01465 [Thermoplasmata archaeon]